MAVKTMPKRGKVGRPEKPGGASRGRIVINCSEEYEAWADEVAVFLRTTRSGAFDRMAAEWAAAHGFKEPPPRT